MVSSAALSWLYEKRWLGLLLLFSTLLVAFGVQEGFEHAQVNHFRDQSVQLPILYSYADETLFPGDILLEARKTYVTWFYPALGVLSRLVPLYGLMLGLYLLSIGLTLTAVYVLAEGFFPQRRAGLVAILLWTIWLPNPGGDFLHSSFPTHTTTAVGLQLLGLALALRNRQNAAALLIGLSLNINAMTGLFVAAVWFFMLLGAPQNWSWRLLKIPCIMAVSALPILYWKLDAGTGQEIPLESFVEIMRTRLWYAVFPFSVDLQLWVLFGLVLLLWYYSARFAPTATNQRVKWMMGGIVALFVIGTIFTEVYPVELVIQLQLLRSTWVLNLFAMLYFANMIAFGLHGSPKQVALALGLTTLLTVPRMVLEFVRVPHPVPYELYMDFAPTGDSPVILDPIGILAVLLLMGGLVWVLRHLLSEELEEKRIIGWFLFTATLLIAPLFVDTAIPTKQSASTAAWRDTLTWVRQNTPPDAQFITPPMLDGFRVYAERTSFSDWKDGTLLIFNSELALEWLERMEALGFDEQSFSFKPLTQAHLCQIAQGYPAMDYAVVLREWGIAGATVYENRFFAVLPLASVPCGGQVVAG